jgi:hypothetical protein
MLERHPDLDADTVAQLLADSSRDLGPAGIDAEFGTGLVDALSALVSGEGSAGRAGSVRAAE